MQHFEMRRKEPKWPFWGQNVFWPFCDFWTVPYTVPSCTVQTVPKLRNDALTPSYTASTVRPYFDGPYRHTVIAQPNYGYGQPYTYSKTHILNDTHVQVVSNTR